MKCKSCDKEYLESELENGICSECAKRLTVTNLSKLLVKFSVISIILSVVISLIIIGIINTDISLSDFEIKSFDMETETSTYTYSENDTTYRGKGTVTCTDKENDYIVLIEEKNKTTKETNYISIIVHEGEGTFSTYDSSYLGVTEKPDYEFNILGFRRFSK